MKSWGVVGLLVLGAAIGFLLLWQSSRDQGRKVQCASNLRQIGIALLLYRNEYRIWPMESDPQPSEAAESALHALFLRNMLDNPEVLTCPMSGDAPLSDTDEIGPVSSSYLWRKDPPSPSDPPPTPLGADKAGNHQGGRNVLFADGTVRWVREEVYQRDIAPLLEPE